MDAVCLQNGMPIGALFWTARCVAGTRSHLCPARFGEWIECKIRYLRLHQWNFHGCEVILEWNAGQCYVHQRNVARTRWIVTVHVDGVWEMKSSVACAHRVFLHVVVSKVVEYQVVETMPTLSRSRSQWHVGPRKGVKV